jgi:hypothetical protein
MIYHTGEHKAASVLDQIDTQPQIEGSRRIPPVHRLHRDKLTLPVRLDFCGVLGTKDC